jgi:NADH-quinone oxidoreductase subunit E
MAILIIETFILTAIAVGAGVLVGVLVKQWFGRRTIGSERLTEVMAAAEAAEAGEVTDNEPSREQSPSQENAVETVGISLAGPEMQPEPEDVGEVLSGPAAEVSAGLDRIATADRLGERPPALPGPRIEGVDDLKRIRGIGPQNAARLNAIGVYHLDQIAAWTPAEARWVGAFLAFPGRIEREDWIGQARTLAAGSETGES